MRNSLAITIIFALTILAAQSAFHPTLWEFMNCKMNVCKSQQCERGDRVCQKASYDYQMCYLSNIHCQNWEKDYNSLLSDDGITENYYKCQRACQPVQATAGAYWSLYECSCTCAGGIAQESPQQVEQQKQIQASEPVTNKKSKSINKKIQSSPSIRLGSENPINSPVRTSMRPTVHEFERCEQKCKTRSCQQGDALCQKAAYDFSECMKTAELCMTWINDYQGSYKNDEIPTSFYECKGICRPNKELSGGFWDIYKCISSCSKEQELIQLEPSQVVENENILVPAVKTEKKHHKSKKHDANEVQQDIDAKCPKPCYFAVCNCRKPPELCRCKAKPICNKCFRKQDACVCQQQLPSTCTVCFNFLPACTCNKVQVFVPSCQTCLQPKKSCTCNVQPSCKVCFKLVPQCVCVKVVEAPKCIEPPKPVICKGCKKDKPSCCCPPPTPAQLCDKCQYPTSFCVCQKKDCCSVCYRKTCVCCKKCKKVPCCCPRPICGQCNTNPCCCVAVKPVIVVKQECVKCHVSPCACKPVVVIQERSCEVCFKVLPFCSCAKKVAVPSCNTCKIPCTNVCPTPITTCVKQRHDHCHHPCQQKVHTKCSHEPLCFKREHNACKPKCFQDCCEKQDFCGPKPVCVVCKLPKPLCRCVFHSIRDGQHVDTYEKNQNAFLKSTPNSEKFEDIEHSFAVPFCQVCFKLPEYCSCPPKKFGQPVCKFCYKLKPYCICPKFQCGNCKRPKDTCNCQSNILAAGNPNVEEKFEDIQHYHCQVCLKPTVYCSCPKKIEELVCANCGKYPCKCDAIPVTLPCDKCYRYPCVCQKPEIPCGVCQQRKCVCVEVEVKQCTVCFKPGNLCSCSKYPVTVPCEKCFRCPCVCKKPEVPCPSCQRVECSCVEVQPTCSVCFKLEKYCQCSKAPITLPCPKCFRYPCQCVKEPQVQCGSCRQVPCSCVVQVQPVCQVCFKLTPYCSCSKRVYLGSGKPQQGVQKFENVKQQPSCFRCYKLVQYCVCSKCTICYRPNYSCSCAGIPQFVSSCNYCFRPVTSCMCSTMPQCTLCYRPYRACRCPSLPPACSTCQRAVPSCVCRRPAPRPKCTICYRETISCTCQQPDYQSICLLCYKPNPFCVCKLFNSNQALKSGNELNEQTPVLQRACKDKRCYEAFGPLDQCSRQDHTFCFHEKKYCAEGVCLKPEIVPEKKCEKKEICVEEKKVVVVPRVEPKPVVVVVDDDKEQDDDNSESETEEEESSSDTCGDTELSSEDEDEDTSEDSEEDKLEVKFERPTIIQWERCKYDNCGKKKCALNDATCLKADFDFQFCYITHPQCKKWESVIMSSSALDFMPDAFYDCLQVCQPKAQLVGNYYDIFTCNAGCANVVVRSKHNSELFKVNKDHRNSILKYEQCLANKCYDYKCHKDDYSCQKNNWEYQICMNSNPTCLKWQDEFATCKASDKLTENFFECNYNCRPPSVSSFDKIFKCYADCASDSDSDDDD